MRWIRNIHSDYINGNAVKLNHIQCEIGETEKLCGQCSYICIKLNEVEKIITVIQIQLHQSTHTHDIIDVIFTSQVRFLIQYINLARVQKRYHEKRVSID